jgi:hypothetical protein
VDRHLITCDADYRDLRIRRVAKELLGVGVESMRDGRLPTIMIHHLTQAGGEDLWVEGALQDILAGLAGMLNW